MNICFDIDITSFVYMIIHVRDILTYFGCLTITGKNELQNTNISYFDLYNFFILIERL